MTVITGELGCVNAVPCVRDWMVGRSSEIQRIITSNTARGPMRVPGNRDWAGRYSTYGHTPPVMPRTGFSFIGSVDGTKGVKGDAIADAVELNIDIEGGKVIECTTEFSGNGVLSVNDTTAVSDASSPDPSSAVQRKVMIAAPAAVPSYADIADVRSVRLRVSAENPDYVTSDTGAQRKRKAGNWDVEFSIPVYGDTMNGLPGPEDVKCLRVYVEAAKYWEILWGMFGEASDFLVDRENAALIGCTLNGGFTGHTLVAAAMTTGWIKLPDASTWWPFV